MFYARPDAVRISREQPTCEKHGALMWRVGDDRWLCAKCYAEWQAAHDKA